MSDVAQLTKKCNNIIQKYRSKTGISWNCRDKNGFPLNWNVRTENIIYKCTSLTKNNVVKVYLGASDGKF